jgi:protein SCO1/2
MKLMSTQMKIAIAGITAFFAVIVTVLVIEFIPTQSDAPSTIQFGAPFKLAAAQEGGTLDSKDLIGKSYGLFFGYTHCPEVCPTTISDMSAALAELGDKAKDFRLFFITIDPERDTAPAMNDYLSNFDKRIEALVPTVEELPKLTKDFHVFYEKIPSEDGNYSMNHTALVFLFNAKGGFASTIAYDETKANRLAKLQKLLSAQ